MALVQGARVRPHRFGHEDEASHAALPGLCYEFLQQARGDTEASIVQCCAHAQHLRDAGLPRHQCARGNETLPVPCGERDALSVGGDEVVEVRVQRWVESSPAVL